MEPTKSISLTTNELASALALCGYETMASQIINSMNLLENEEEFTRFVQQVEFSFKVNGLWDEKRSSMLVKGLEDLIQLLVHSTKKIRCIKDNNVLLIHLADKNYVLLQKIVNRTHSFTLLPNEKEFSELLIKHFNLNRIANKQKSVQTIILSSEIFDNLHQIDEFSLDTMMNENKLDSQIKRFLKDFKNNNQEFDNISFLEMDYIKDYIN
ncbi:hypothetical protein J9303_21105, partial [Bacillaceae bacterium Marseille-Q3522]|nr:hypothetical protein [Bacillaceae bacterium Marseille-Q3522]